MNIITRFSRSGNFRIVKSWGDPVMKADGYSTSVRLVLNPNTGQMERMGQFSHVVPYQPTLGDSTWSANDLACSLTNAQLLAIASIQQDDEYSVDQKMNWLTDSGDGSWGAPIRCNGDWLLASDARLIAGVWAGQPVELTGEHSTFLVSFNDKVVNVPMSRIYTFYDWSHISRTHPQVVECTAVDANDRPILPHGHIYLPLVFRTGSVWVFDRWLV